jgi:hypothetical protein
VCNPARRKLLGYVLDCCKPVAGVARVLGDSLEYRAQR